MHAGNVVCNRFRLEPESYGYLNRRDYAHLQTEPRCQISKLMHLTGTMTMTLRVWMWAPRANRNIRCTSRPSSRRDCAQRIWTDSSTSLHRLHTHDMGHTPREACQNGNGWTRTREDVVWVLAEEPKPGTTLTLDVVFPKIRTGV